MENKNKKCSKKDHSDITAISYCQDCKIFICNKCLIHHNELFNNHLINNLEKDIEIFIDLCQEKNHHNKLEFYCKNHNKLCCAACISKLGAKGFGQHKDCEVFIIEDIKEEKKNKLKDNIKYLEDLSSNFNTTVNELKKIFEMIDEKKEELKSKIQNIFTKLRTALNEKEDELLLEIDNKYENLFGNEDIIKESEKLPNKIKISLEKGKLIDKEWNDNNLLSSIISNCINIEENIKNINIINDNIKKYKDNKDIKIEFNIKNEELENFIKSIKSFGQIYKISKLDSLILKNGDESEKFFNLISNKIKITNIELLYRASRDGLDLNNLRDKIENKTNLIFLFLTGNTRIFGTYIKSQIKVKHDFYIADKDAFTFSLNNNKIYKILNPDLAIRFYMNNPILIGNNAKSNGFWIYSGKVDDKGLLNSPKAYDFEKNYELTEGLNEFKELEIFEIK